MIEKHCPFCGQTDSVDNSHEGDGFVECLLCCIRVRVKRWDMRVELQRFRERIRSKIAYHRDGLGPDVPVLQERYDALIKERDELKERLEVEKVQPPYIKVLCYNKLYGDERECICGHLYYRHFDTYEGMSPVGCKYCRCFEFVEKKFNDKEENSNS